MLQSWHPGSSRRPSLVQRVLLVAERPQKAAEALALKVCVKTHLVFLCELARHCQLTVLPLKAVGEGAEVEVNVTVWVFAQTAAVRTAQGLAAQLCRRGDVEQVLTQRAPEINIQVGAGGLKQKWRKQPLLYFVELWRQSHHSHVSSWVYVIVDKFLLNCFCCKEHVCHYMIYMCGATGFSMWNMFLFLNVFAVNKEHMSTK